MSAVWDLNLPDSEKLVALALADWCNDQGECWPSVPQIAKKCSKSVRTVQGVLASLESKSVLKRNMVAGKGTFYRLTPAEIAPPAAAAPPQRSRKTPAAAAPNTLGTVISSEAKASSDRRERARLDFSDLVVADWNRAIAGSPLPPAKRMTPARRKALAARVREHGEDAVLTAILGLVRSDFHSGRDGKWTGGDLGWLLKPESFAKMLERGGRTEFARPPTKPNVAGGSLFRKLQAGEISREEFDLQRAAALRAQQSPPLAQEQPANPLVRAGLAAEARYAAEPGASGLWGDDV